MEDRIRYLYRLYTVYTDTLLYNVFVQGVAPLSAISNFPDVRCLFFNCLKEK